MCEHPRAAGSTLLAPLALISAEFQDFSNTLGILKVWIVMLLILRRQWSSLGSSMCVRVDMCWGRGGWYKIRPSEPTQSPTRASPPLFPFTHHPSPSQTQLFSVWGSLLSPRGFSQFYVQILRSMTYFLICSFSKINFGGRFQQLMLACHLVRNRCFILFG